MDERLPCKNRTAGATLPESARARTHQPISVRSPASTATREKGKPADAGVVEPSVFGVTARLDIARFAYARAPRPSAAIRRTTANAMPSVFPMRPTMRGGARLCNGPAPLLARLLFHRDVFLQARDFILVHVLADLAPELLDRLVRTVLLELVLHLVAHSGDQQNLFSLRRIEIDRLPHDRVDRLSL